MHKRRVDPVVARGAATNVMVAPRAQPRHVGLGPCLIEDGAGPSGPPWRAAAAHAPAGWDFLNAWLVRSLSPRLAGSVTGPRRTRNRTRNACRAQRAQAEGRAGRERPHYPPIQADLAPFSSAQDAIGEIQPRVADRRHDGAKLGVPGEDDLELVEPVGGHQI